MQSKSGVSVTRSLAMNRSESGAIIGVKGYMLGKIIRIKSNVPITIGRDSSQCELLVKGEKVSRVHCTVIYNDATGDYTVRDLSSNGVVVDDKYKLKKNVDVRVKSGSILSIGNNDNQLRLG